LAFALIFGIVVAEFLRDTSVAAYVAVSGFGIVLAFGGVAGIIFIPKYYIIYFNPEKLKELSSSGSSSRMTTFGSIGGLGSSIQQGGNSGPKSHNSSGKAGRS